MHYIEWVESTSYTILCGRYSPTKITNGMQGISIHTNMHCVVSCSHDIFPLHIHGMSMVCIQFSVHGHQLSNVVSS